MEQIKEIQSCIKFLEGGLDLLKYNIKETKLNIKEFKKIKDEDLKKLLLDFEYEKLEILKRSKTEAKEELSTFFHKLELLQSFIEIDKAIENIYRER